jgi:hypothetical protein
MVPAQTSQRHDSDPPQDCRFNAICSSEFGIAGDSCLSSIAVTCRGRSAVTALRRMR